MLCYTKKGTIMPRPKTLNIRKITKRYGKKVKIRERKNSQSETILKGIASEIITRKYQLLLKLKQCGPVHWQLIGGQTLLNIWPSVGKVQRDRGGSAIQMKDPKYIVDYAIGSVFKDGPVVVHKATAPKVIRRRVPEIRKKTEERHQHFGCPICFKCRKPVTLNCNIGFEANKMVHEECKNN